ncbi:Putative calpain 1 [Gryllus bimaculatus]|nr:Putative calpain 1 [Gryllus bimaculatus]
MISYCPTKRIVSLVCDDRDANSYRVHRFPVGAAPTHIAPPSRCTTAATTQPTSSTTLRNGREWRARNVRTPPHHRLPPVPADPPGTMHHPHTMMRNHHGGGGGGGGGGSNHHHHVPHHSTHVSHHPGGGSGPVQHHHTNGHAKTNGHVSNGGPASSRYWTNGFGPRPDDKQSTLSR